ncbi:transcriptional regulator LytR [Virgibacillus profundi]|uniref:Polyisoprenyl-teichoic acid--peptidoglycan teichoic acid transferase TagU n=1 Tax=Virgibacillus profundi TaxID=2024555 RepID=A0A2A2IIN2_9BACI|nr:LCP family protein [Virgibacillus profundi]PAV31000.1 transcriptional regulator LytR [Virgibacillus profundi]PXY55185.1 transcriptional regulator LytR [Virgibacillus profundi]
MNSRVDKRRTKKKRKWPFLVGGIILVLLLIVVGYVYYVWDKVGDTVETMHNPLARDDDPERQKELENIFEDKKSLNILLLGVDQREGDKGRSDTMILMSLNPNTDSMAMVSIPRDTYVNIPGRGMDKINHAYAFGDVELAVQTVEEAFDLPVHFYSKVNMEGFKQGIDAIGGVTVTNDQAFSQGGSNFSEGQIQLNGEQALSYIRMRKNDPRGDLGRNERQRNVVQAAIKEGASFSSITKVGEILNILGDNVNTDLNMDRMQTMFSGYRGTIGNTKTLEISGSGKMINGGWYYIVPDSEFNRITTEITNHMEAR